MSTYSHSRITTFEKCPYKYKLRYIDKVETNIEGIEAYLGKCVHTAIEQIYRDIDYGKLNSLQEIIQFYEDHWEKNWHSNIKIVKKDHNKNQYKIKGKNCIVNYYNTNKPFCDGKTIEIEKHINVSLNDKYFIQGYIDRLVLTANGDYEIHDYKTSNNLPTQEEINNDWQLPIYQMAIHHKWPDAKNIKLVWFYLSFNKRMESTRNIQDIENLKQEILKKIKIIESETKFLPKKSSLCAWCDYETFCPKQKHLFFVTKSITKEETKLVDNYVSLKEKKKKLEQELKKIEEEIIGYTKENNSEILTGKEYSLQVKMEEKLKFPTKDEPKRENLDNLIKEYGKWEEVSNLNLLSLPKKMQEWDNELHEKIEKYITKTIEPSFLLFKNKDKK